MDSDSEIKDNVEIKSTEKTFLFTSESVGEGHPGNGFQSLHFNFLESYVGFMFPYFIVPDKMCDTISDAILDAQIKLDKEAKIACGNEGLGIRESSM